MEIDTEDELDKENEPQCVPKKVKCIRTFVNSSLVYM